MLSWLLIPRVQNGGAFAPEVVELDVPTGLRIVVPSGYGQPCIGQSCYAHEGVGYENVTDVSGAPGGGALSVGYSRLRLNKQAAYEWSYLNIAIALRIELNASLEGKTFPLSRVRAYSGAANQARADNWQPLAITVKTLVPVPRLPQRLHTAFCWAEPFQVLRDPPELQDLLFHWSLHCIVCICSSERPALSVSSVC